MTGWRSVAAGMAVLALVAIAAVIAVLAAPRAHSEGERYEVTARFDNVGGLDAGAGVTVSGVRVGRVVSVTYDANDYTARVRMRIEAGARLPADTGASIYTLGLVGERYVELDPGGSTVLLNDGDELPLTNSAVILEHVIGQLIYGAPAAAAGY